MLQRIRQQLNNQKGFTLMELMVVIAIIGILVAIALPKFSEAAKSAQIAQAKADVRTVMGSLEMYAADNNGSYPADLTAAKAALVTKYLRAWPADVIDYNKTSSDPYWLNTNVKNHTGNTIDSNNLNEN